MQRYEQLDSIRGLASLTVVFYHIMLVTYLPIISLILSPYLPFSVSINGHSSVIMFFMLSGFVLALPYFKGTHTSYVTFLTKRFFRIYVPYLISLGAVGIAYTMLSSQNGITELSDWFNNTWTKDLTTYDIIMHLLLIPNYNSDLLNNVIWSLIQEMRISIIFPLLAFILINMNWKYILLICFGCSIISGLNNNLDLEMSYGFHTAFLDTLHYISIFLIGGILAKHREYLIKLYCQILRHTKIIFLLVAFIFYHYWRIPRKITETLGLYDYAEIVGDYSIVVGAGLFIVIALGSQKLASFLEIKIFKYLGNISYSLYLYHLIVLYSLLYLFYEQIPITTIYILTLILSLIVATISYYFVEIPSIKLGKLLTKKWKVKLETVSNEKIIRKF